MARITCYDGVGCIGGNKILLEHGDTKLWLDFGLDFGRMGIYYEEFLKPKSCLGLYEPAQMELLPPIPGLYRSDLVCGLANPWQGISTREVGDVHGILLSHAHLDHLGSLHYVREDIPIYSSAMTLAIAKATEDTGSGTPDQWCYTELYEPGETGELRSAYFARNPSKSRPYSLVGETPSASLSEFWRTTPSSLLAKGRAHEECEIGVASQCGGLNVRQFPLDHSIYGASAWAIETGSGWIVYTGDLRCHGGQADLTRRFAEEVAALKPLALIIEGTRIEEDGTSTEEEVRDRALKEVKKAKGLVVADFGPRNVERLISFLQIAKETGRKLVLLPKDAYLLEKMALVDPSVPTLNDTSILIYNKYEAATQNWKKLIKEKYPERLVQPSVLAQRQDRAICCFSFWDVNELAYIKPAPGSIWIYSSCEAFTEEMEIDMKRLHAWLDLYGVKFLGGTDADEKNPFHVSGHACKADLLRIIEMISPQTVIPVHTEHPEMFAEALAGRCEVKLPERGVPIEL